MHFAFGGIIAGVGFGLYYIFRKDPFKAIEALNLEIFNLVLYLICYYLR
jgi:EamA domain-containing membrane protein RarD